MDRNRPMELNRRWTSAATINRLGAACVAVSMLAVSVAAPVAAAAVPPLPSRPAMFPVDLAESRVFIVGDSLTVGSAGSLRRQLAPHVKSVRIDASVGRHTGEGVSRLRTSAARSANIWVVALGTNDSPSSQQTKRNVARVMGLAGKDRRVIWVNVVRPGGYSRVNSALAEIDAREGRLTVIDWAAVIRRQRELLSGDRVHLTSKGYRVRATATRNAVLALGGDALA